ncbi:hypothetical protein [Hyalangium gracile]|uniref:hypothetical protein n=1 Tax=Hyalangium gracile TaxID=394092 RepID=UPI001CC96433|nr:hypothetical protein [Hyalangium gracile]
MSKQPTEPLRSIRLPREVELELQEEMTATDRSANSIVAEALRLRRAILEAMGVGGAGTEPSALADSATRLIKLGLKAQQARK